MTYSPEANNPNLKSWVQGSEKSEFPIQNLPLGLYTTEGIQTPRAASAIGGYILDLCELASLGLLEGTGVDKAHLEGNSINGLLKLGRKTLGALRTRLSELLREDYGQQEKLKPALIKLEEVQLLLPVEIGDYTDFYSSREHATNVGTMFRDPENALLPNWLHLPVGYHGRASSIVVSGTDIRRPKGQQMPADADKPVFGPSKLLDFELEMAFVICKENTLGEHIPIEEAEEHIAGLMLFNDWSARDIQKWEYVPLGPFLAKNFASTVSPWIVLLDALEPYRVQGPTQVPEVLPYLSVEGEKNYDIDLEVVLITQSKEEKILCKSNFKYMYWNMCQQLAHHTVNGCNVRVGDLYASGTISGPDASSFGSMLEITWKGSRPIQLNDGTERKFIQDGDTVVLRGRAGRNGLNIGFGEASGKVLPAN